MIMASRDFRRQQTWANLHMEC